MLRVDSGASSQYRSNLTALEQTRRAPLDIQDSQFPLAQTRIVYEEGTHIGINPEGTCVFAVRITYVISSSQTSTSFECSIYRPFSELSTEKLKAMKVITDYSTCANIVGNNAV